MDLGFSAALLEIGGLALLGLTSLVRRHVPMRIFLQLGTISSGLVTAGNWLLSFLAQGNQRLFLGLIGGVYGGATGYLYALWRKHKDDDDDFGKRAKRWLRNRLPKPTVRATRTTGS